MTWQQFRVRITPVAERGLRRLAKKLGKTQFRRLKEAILALGYDPAGKTQQLYGALAEYRSLHWGRCRVIIQIDEVVVTVRVVAAGWHTTGDRSDVYQEALRLLESGRLDPESREDEPEEDS